MNIDPKQFDALKQAVAEDRVDDFRQLVETIIQQTIRNRLARREASRPARPWIPTQV